MPVILAVIVAVLLAPLWSVSVNAWELAAAFCAIVLLAGAVEPRPWWSGSR